MHADPIRTTPRVCLAPTCGLTHRCTEAFSQCRCPFCDGTDLESAPWTDDLEPQIRRAVETTGPAPRRLRVVER